MFSITMKLCSLLLVIAGLCTFVSGRTQTPAPTPASDRYVTNSGFKNKVFEVHHRMPEDLLPVIRLLTSGFKGAELSAANEFRTITVRDFPENIAAIEEAIKRLDTPEPARPNVELRIHVLLASNQEGTAGQYPADLKDVIAELQKTLTFKEYSLLTSITQRTRESGGFHANHIEGRGSAELHESPQVRRITNYQFSANSISISTTASGPAEIQLGDFSFFLAAPGTEARIRSDVRMRDGEKVVVGTAGFQDKALILVMSCRVLK